MRLLVPALLVLLLAPPAQAGFRKGPYLLHPTADSVVVAWESDTPAPGAVQLPDRVIESPARDTVHHVRVGGLEPETPLTYTVQADGTRSAPATLQAAPRPGAACTLVVVGDTQGGASQTAALVDAILREVPHPDLILHAGDLVDDASSADEWQGFFDAFGPLLADAPLVAAPGNHDDADPGSLFRRYLGGSEPRAVPWGPWRVLVLDSNRRFRPQDAQLSWLDQLPPGQRRELALYHHATFSSGGHGVRDARDWRPGRRYLAPLLSRRGVELVVSGHDHHYERSRPQLTGGPLYLVAGGGSAGSLSDALGPLGWAIEALIGLGSEQVVGQYLEQRPRLWAAARAVGLGRDYEAGWWRARARVARHFVVIEADDARVEGRAVGLDGGVFDRWVLGAPQPAPDAAGTGSPRPAALPWLALLLIPPVLRWIRRRSRAAG